MTSLVTGFPGFIGRRLVARLLDRDPGARVVCVVEPRMAAVARGLAGERLEVVEGDIGERRLGLDNATFSRLAGAVRRVFHLAAIYNLSVPFEVAQRVNVEGTGNVLELCRACDGLERLAYISTAYVAGDRTGTIYEHELVMGQRFKNHYEATKFQAEVWVREEMGRVPATVMRPAIVVGDSRTGETVKFDGPYYLLRAIAQAERHGRRVLQFGRLAAKFNVVPVDYVVEAILAAAFDPAALGETLHLVDPEPLSARELLVVMSREYAGRDPKGRVPPRLVERGLRVPAIRHAFNDTPPESIAYLNHPVVFDARRSLDLLTPHGLRPPVFADYAGAMVRYFRDHEAD